MEAESYPVAVAGWTPEWPTEPGSYWFYGKRMPAGYTDGADHLFYVKVDGTSKEGMIYQANQYMYDGVLLYESEVTGVWQKAVLPALPGSPEIVVGDIQKELADFGKRAAKVFDETRSSTVFFLLQRCFPENEDEWEWADYQKLLNRLLGKRAE